MKCPNCGCDVRNEAEFCPHCGYIFPLSPRVGPTSRTSTMPRAGKRARRAKRIAPDYHDVVVVLLFLILLLEIIQLLVMIG